MSVMRNEAFTGPTGPSFDSKMAWALPLSASALFLAAVVSLVSVVRPHVSVASLEAQTPTFVAPDLGPGSVAGVVVDSAGAAIPDVSIRLSADTTGGSVATTNHEGRFRFSSVPEGIYNLTATRTGFQPASRNGVEVKPDQEAVVDFTLLPVPRRVLR